jgi:hypothetical protein
MPESNTTARAESANRRPHAALRMTSRQILPSLVFLLGYAVVIFFFAQIDVYNKHFFDASYSAAYNIGRIIFGIYLFFILYVTGDDIIYLCRRRSPMPLALGCGEKIVVCFFAGAVIWQLFIFAVGYLSLYTRPIIVAFTLPIILRASLKVGPFLAEIFHALRRQLRSYRDYGLFSSLLVNILLVLLIGAACLLIVVKGLYPAGGHDYYTHYFYYFTTSIENHSLWPNDVWYQYFFSNGDAEFFLGMLLSDPLAPSVVTYCFIVVATLALFLFIDRMKPGTLWPWAAALCYLLVLIYNGGQQGLRVDGSNYWAEFPKEHELNTAFIIAYIWLCDGLLRVEGAGHRLFLWVAAGCAFAVVFIEFPTSLIEGLFNIVIALSLISLRKIRNSLEFLLLACVSGAGLVVCIIVNYLTTGIPNDTLLNLFWPVVNLKKVESLGWLWVVLQHSRDMIGIPCQAHQTTLGMWWQELIGYFHAAVIQAWFGYIQGAVFGIGALAILCIERRKIPQSTRAPALLIVGFLIAFLISTATIGISVPDSFFRYSSFMLPFEFAAVAMIWISIGSLSGLSWVRSIVRTGVPILAAGLFVIQLWELQHVQMMAVIREGIRFVSGRYSIYDGYVHQADWPTRAPWGGVYPGSLAVWKEVGPGPRVWTFHIHAYCMLPGCDWESDRSFSVSPHMFDIVFGTPEQARDILKREGLNYFLYSRELQIRDIMPATSLFSPEHIGDYIGVKWTDGTTYLLTWLGPGIQPLTADWIAEYRSKISESDEIASFWQNRPDFLEVYSHLKSDNPTWGYQLQRPWRAYCS